MSRSCSDPYDRSNVYIDQSELTRNLGKRVIGAEKWQCPLENGYQVLSVLGIEHRGVVVTLEDHITRYLVHKLPGKEAGVGDVVVAYASGMGSNWKRFDEKTVKYARLSDYLDQCGYKYYTMTDNCLHAVDRMWHLN